MPPENPPTDDPLAPLRLQIDEVDSEVVRLLRRRAGLAHQVRDVKQAMGTPVYSPAREREILAGLTEERLGDFPVTGAQAVFREIISACRALEESPRVAYLGPRGTFSEVAARERWGECADYLPYDGFARIFDALYGGDATFAMVPIENSTAGTIREVLDQVAAGRKFTIIGESFVDVHHCLLSHTAVSQITEVWSRDTVLDQCRSWLRANLPNARLVPVSSTALGVERAAEDASLAAIGTELAGQVYGVPLQARNVEDLKDNRTRFFALGPYMPVPTGRDRTSILMIVEHRPGALASALETLREHGLNMTLIESRPSRTAPFEYSFFIDFEGHSREPEVAAGIEALRQVCLRVHVLGSYPRAVG
jgi:chorismate mutase/prephenate dehydratase